MSTALILGGWATAASAQTPCDHKVTELIAGKDTDVGNVNVCNDSTTLTVTYEATTPWCLVETNLQAGSSLDDFPLTKKGNPKTDEFDYGDAYPVCEGSATLEIPLDAIGADTTVVIAANATVENQLTRKEDGAWGAGMAFPGAKNRAMNFTYETCGLAKNLCEVGPSSCPEGEVVSYDPSDGSCECVAGQATTFEFFIRIPTFEAIFFLSGNVFESNAPAQDSLNAPDNAFTDELTDIVEQAFGVDACPGDITVTAGPGPDPFVATTIGVTLAGFQVDDLRGLLQASDPGGSKYIGLLTTAETQMCGQAIRDDACSYADEINGFGNFFSVSCPVADVYTVTRTRIRPFDANECFDPDGCTEVFPPSSYDLRACPVTGPGLYRKTPGASGFWS